MCVVVCCSYRGGDDDDGCMIVESRSINVCGRDGDGYEVGEGQRENGRGERWTGIINIQRLKSPSHRQCHGQVDGMTGKPSRPCRRHCERLVSVSPVTWNDPTPLSPRRMNLYPQPMNEHVGSGQTCSRPTVDVCRCARP